MPDLVSLVSITHPTLPLILSVPPARANTKKGKQAAENTRSLFWHFGQPPAPAPGAASRALQLPAPAPGPASRALQLPAPARAHSSNDEEENDLSPQPPAHGHARVPRVSQSAENQGVEDLANESDEDKLSVSSNVMLMAADAVVDKSDSIEAAVGKSEGSIEIEAEASDSIEIEASNSDGAISSNEIEVRNSLVRSAGDAGLDEGKVGASSTRPRSIQQVLRPRGVDIPHQDQAVNENSFWRLHQDSKVSDLHDSFRLWFEQDQNVLAGLFQDPAIQPTIAQLLELATRFGRHFHLPDSHCPTIADLEVFLLIHFRPWERFLEGLRHLAINPSTNTFTEKCLSFPVQVFARTAQFLYLFNYHVALIGAHTTLGFGNAVPLDGPWDQCSSGADNASARARYRQIRDATAPLQRRVVRFLIDQSPNLHHVVVLGEAAFDIVNENAAGWLGRLLPAFRIALLFVILLDLGKYLGIMIREKREASRMMNALPCGCHEMTWANPSFSTSSSMRWSIIGNESSESLDDSFSLLMLSGSFKRS